MAFASGVYTGLSNTFNNATAGTIIDQDDWNDLFTDIETALNAAANGKGSQAVTDVASATTTDIGAATTSVARITGTTTITSLGTAANTRRYVVFAASLTLTHNATSLILPGAANITTQAGDTCLALSDASGNWRVYAYQTAQRTGTGKTVLDTSPTLIAPDVGTPSAGVLTNCTGLPISTGVSGLGTGIATALAVNTGSTGAPTLFNGALGTPSSGTLTNCTGLPVAGITSSTSTALGVGSLEVGNASDTTISRDSAGVIAVEGIPLYPNIPQNSQSAAYTTVLADAQKHILHPSGDNNARTFTIAANASVAYPIGTAITFVNLINTVTIAINSDTLILAGVGTTGSRTLAANGLATAIKVASTTWIISGSGLT